MASITLRRMPGHLHAVLKNEAEANCRSVAQEIIARLERSLDLDSATRRDQKWVDEALASGKPVDVEHTGPSRYLPDHGGLFRFRTPAEAATYLDEVVDNYDEHSRIARQLAEEHFDAKKLATRVLEAIA